MSSRGIDKFNSHFAGQFIETTIRRDYMFIPESGPVYDLPYGTPVTVNGEHHPELQRGFPEGKWHVQHMELGQWGYTAGNAVAKPIGMRGKFGTTDFHQIGGVPGQVVWNGKTVPVIRYTNHRTLFGSLRYGLRRNPVLQGEQDRDVVQQFLWYSEYRDVPTVNEDWLDLTPSVRRELGSICAEQLAAIIALKGDLGDFGIPRAVAFPKNSFKTIDFFLETNRGTFAISHKFGLGAGESVWNILPSLFDHYLPPNTFLEDLRSYYDPTLKNGENILRWARHRHHNATPAATIYEACKLLIEQWNNCRWSRQRFYDEATSRSFIQIKLDDKTWLNSAKAHYHITPAHAATGISFYPKASNNSDSYGTVNYRLLFS